MTNFSQCRDKYTANLSLYANYSYHGRVIGITPNPATQISYEGCKSLCGTGNDRYSWSISSSTITTWLLPIVGTLLQAPFLSNEFWSTALLLARWIGSPMSSLACILWNISVSGKCAMMVDMAVEYDQPSLNEEADLDKQQADFRSIRDSFYILLAMNQYSIKTTSTSKAEAEGLLRIVLFSKDLRLKGTDMKLREMRQELAQSLRQRRRRNAVPVFISTMWFLFSLGISIQSAFGQVGDNATAHDLALGLLLAWLPVLVLCSIVDCGSVSAKEIRDSINSLIDLVCVSLQDPAIVREFIDSFRTRPEFEVMEERVMKIAAQSNRLQGGFFTSFAGQGRVRWHYGVAHPILSDIENCYIAEHGRNWLVKEEEARTKLVLGSAGRGLFWFDFREIWQISSAMAIVGGTILGAFIISYFEPTVGLGCRSLGYLIFAAISLSLVILEFLVWRFTSFTTEDRLEEEHRQSITSQRRNPTRKGSLFDSSSLLKRTNIWTTGQLDKIEGALLNTLPRVLTTFDRGENKLLKQEKLHHTLPKTFKKYRSLTLRQYLHYLVFIPLEIMNMIWLLYIIFAQTFGLFVNCRCKSSIYGLHGGYVDLVETTTAPGAWAKRHWVAGTVLSCSIMGISAAYIVLEWCLQSHLGTEDVQHARRGLSRVRTFRRRVFWIRYPLVRYVLFVNGLREVFLRRRGEKQRTLVWTRKVTFDPSTTLTNAIGHLNMPVSYGREKGGGDGDGFNIQVISVNDPMELQHQDDAVSPMSRPLSTGTTDDVFVTPRNSFPPFGRMKDPDGK